MSMERNRNSAPLQGITVLIVEDEFLIAIEMERLLADAGAKTIHRCETVEDALLATEDNSFSAAILDFCIGRQTVTPVARRLASRGIPFIFHTAHAATDTIRSEWPTCQIISKPARSRDIINAIAVMAIKDTSL